jgi:hypothetical protein
VVYYSPDYSWTASVRDHDDDGYADKYDAFPNDSTEWNDTDGDGYGDNSDAFPNDSTEWDDSDGDGFGDNIDEFPEDVTEWCDTDEDGYGDNGDVFPDDSTEWIDTDDDGVGDNADWFDEGDATIFIMLEYYAEDGTADFWTSGDPFFVIKADTDGDSMWDTTTTSLVCSDTASLSGAFFMLIIEVPDDEIPVPITFTIEVWESDIEGNYEMDYNPAATGSYWTVETSAYPFEDSWYYDGGDDGVEFELDCELQFLVCVLDF